MSRRRSYKPVIKKQLCEVCGKPASWRVENKYYCDKCVPFLCPAEEKKDVEV